jgi:hypothetical protein
MGKTTEIPVDAASRQKSSMVLEARLPIKYCANTAPMAPICQGTIRPTAIKGSH